MKIRTDLIKMYKEVHSWVGIIAGLALFIAFYAGAITMFEEPIQRWASPPTELATAVPLDRTPELIDKVLATHPEAANGYVVAVQIDGNRPARVSWATGGRGTPDPRVVHYAALDANGALQVTQQGPSPVGQFIDVLHQQVGFAFWPEITRPLMGVIALLYSIAIVSGLVVLLPSLVSDLFALRIGKNVKRMWLDVHNLLGLFSLPFHLVMAVTSIGFAFHDQYYDLQKATLNLAGRPPITHEAMTETPSEPALPPHALVARLRAQAPNFEPLEVHYEREPDGSLETGIVGRDPRYGLRGPTQTEIGVDPHTGAVLGTNFTPGMQPGYAAYITGNFALHFGNYGGAPIRWSYFLLGFAGAILFYTGNLLWVESRRKKERKAGLPEQTRATRILGALTVGIPLGCIAGISVTLAAAKLLGTGATLGQHSMIYYAIFLAFTAYALIRGAARSGIELAGAAAIATLCVPLASLRAGGDWYQAGATILVDIAAVAVAATLLVAMRSAYQRAKTGPRDSIWAVPATT